MGQDRQDGQDKRVHYEKNARGTESLFILNILNILDILLSFLVARFQTAPTGEKSLDCVLWVEGWRGTGPRPTGKGRVFS